MKEDKVYELYRPMGFKIYFFFMVSMVVGACLFLIYLTFFGTQQSPPTLFTLFPIVIFLYVLFHYLKIPYRIILRQDNTLLTISLVAKRQVPVSSIKSIKPESYMGGFYMIKAQKKIRILTNFDNFHDLIFQLKTLNPDIDLRGC